MADFRAISKRLYSRSILQIILLLAVSQQSWAQMNALHAFETFKQQADSAYAAANYRNAFNMYQRLAAVGDKFAQYRLAVMYAEGQSVSADASNAYAWSKLAAENAQPVFVRFHAQIKAGLDPSQLTEAEAQADELFSRYGVFANALAARKMLDTERRNCGSRTGSRCDAVTAYSPGGCSGNFDRWPSELCLRIGSLGLLGIAGSFPASLNRLETALDIVIEQYNPGNVELRELELLEDATDDASDDPQ